MGTTFRPISAFCSAPEILIHIWIQAPAPLYIPILVLDISYLGLLRCSIQTVNFMGHLTVSYLWIETGTFFPCVAWIILSLLTFFQLSRVEWACARKCFSCCSPSPLPRPAPHAEWRIFNSSFRTYLLLHVCFHAKTWTHLNIPNWMTHPNLFARSVSDSAGLEWVWASLLARCDPDPRYAAQDQDTHVAATPGFNDSQSK